MAARVVPLPLCNIPSDKADVIKLARLGRALYNTMANGNRLSDRVPTILACQSWVQWLCTQCTGRKTGFQVVQWSCCSFCGSWPGIGGRRSCSQDLPLHGAR